MSEPSEGFFSKPWSPTGAPESAAEAADAAAQGEPADPLDMLPGRFVAADVRAQIGQLAPATMDTGDAVWAQINELIDIGLRRCEVLAVLVAADRFDDHRDAARAYLDGQRAELEEMREGYRASWKEFTASAARARAIIDDANREIIAGGERRLRDQRAAMDEQRRAFEADMEAKRRADDERNKQWYDAFLGNRRRY